MVTFEFMIIMLNSNGKGVLFVHGVHVIWNWFGYGMAW